MDFREMAEKIIDYVESNLSHDANITTEWVTDILRAAHHQGELDGLDRAIAKIKQTLNPCPCSQHNPPLRK